MPKSIPTKITAFKEIFSREMVKPRKSERSIIELPKQLGGLGSGNLMQKKLVLLFSLWWRFSRKDDIHWKRIITSVHDVKGVIASTEAFSNTKCGAWA